MKPASGRAAASARSLYCGMSSTSGRSLTALAQPAAQQCQPRRGRRTSTQASLFSSVAETATLVAAVGGLTLSALPLLTGEARERNADRPFNEERAEEDFVYGVMSAVSFLPYVNWTVIS